MPVCEQVFLQLSDVALQPAKGSGPQHHSTADGEENHRANVGGNHANKRDR